MTNSTDYDEVLQYMRGRFGGRIKKKSDSMLMKVIDLFLKVITFGKMNTFMTGFITTIGTTVYVTNTWEPSPSRAVTLRHEMVHMEQSRRYTWPLYAFLYLFVFLPGGLAYFRAKFEKEAYEESMYGALQVHGAAVLTRDAYRENIIGHFTSAEYFWMWPFRESMDKWYDSAHSKALARLHTDGN